MREASPLYVSHVLALARGGMLGALRAGLAGHRARLDAGQAVEDEMIGKAGLYLLDVFEASFCCCFGDCGSHSLWGCTCTSGACAAPAEPPSPPCCPMLQRAQRVLWLQRGHRVMQLVAWGVVAVGLGRLARRAWRAARSGGGGGGGGVRRR